MSSYIEVTSADHKKVLVAIFNVVISLKSCVSSPLRLK